MVSHMSFLEEFHLLHNSRQDICEKPWSQPAIRELMKLSQRVKRAHEEIQRCHIAVRRLYTAIYDEEDNFTNTLSQLQDGDPCIYGVVYDFISHRRQVNDLLLARLTRLVGSPDYSGDYSRGVWVGHGGSSGSHGQPPPDDVMMTGALDHEDEPGSDEDETDELVGQLVDYVSDLSLLP